MPAPGPPAGDPGDFPPADPTTIKRHPLELGFWQGLIMGFILAVFLYQVGALQWLMPDHQAP